MFDIKRKMKLHDRKGQESVFGVLNMHFTDLKEFLHTKIYFQIVAQDET